MATKWVSALALDGGTDLIRARASMPGRVKMHVIKAYAKADSYATVIGNSCAVVDMTAADYVQSSLGSSRVMTVGAKNGARVTASSGAKPDLHIAHVDSVSSEVLYVTDEESDQALILGNAANVPAHTYTTHQPE